jgi:hypothetical protein
MTPSWNKSFCEMSAFSQLQKSKNWSSIFLSFVAFSCNDFAAFRKIGLSYFGILIADIIENLIFKRKRKKRKHSPKWSCRCTPKGNGINEGFAAWALRLCLVFWRPKWELCAGAANYFWVFFFLFLKTEANGVGVRISSSEDVIWERKQ